MKTAALAVLLLSSVLVSSNGRDLHSLCGTTHYVFTKDARQSYQIRKADDFHSLCDVILSSFLSSGFLLDISGERLDPAQCSVSVLAGDDYRIIVSNITSTGYFTRTFNSTGLCLHVQGPECSGLGLTITISPICTSYQTPCKNGQCVARSDVCDGFSDCSDGSDEDGCFWTVGTIVGISCGGVAFVTFLAVLSIVYYRRRLVVVRHPMLIQPGHSSVCVASNPSSINGNTVVNPVK